MRWVALLLCHALALPSGPPTLVSCNTTQGPFQLEIYPSWAPLGAARFLSLVSSGFFNTRVALFRVVPNFLVQFGVAGDPLVSSQWAGKGTIPDDPNVLESGKFERGMISFAGSGPNSRTTQMFIAFRDSQHLGHSPWETPFGKVVGDGMTTVDKFYAEYGDLPVFGGKGPNGHEIEQYGAGWVKERYPSLDFIESCIVEPTKASRQEEL